MARVALPERRSLRLFSRDSRGPSDCSLRARRPGHSTFFLPGATIPESGIYEVVHDDAHRVAHESVLVKGDAFPFCDICGERVRFRVVRTAPYIFEDDDFEA